eukprot:scaffold76896_cov53-Cyclotella_meneghiniana.AAC.1
MCPGLAEIGRVIVLLQWVRRHFQGRGNGSGAAILRRLFCGPRQPKPKLGGALRGTHLSCRSNIDQHKVNIAISKTATQSSNLNSRGLKPPMPSMENGAPNLQILVSTVAPCDGIDESSCSCATISLLNAQDETVSEKVIQDTYDKGQRTSQP